MTLRNHLSVSGTWLFRWRSFLPLVLVVPTLAAMRGYTWPYGSHRVQEYWEMLCYSVSLAGLAVRIATVGFAPAKTSGRNTRYQQAAQLNTTGMYSIVRHPLYVGNYLMFLGVSLFPREWWVPVLVSIAFFFYYERIIYVEEEFLRRKFGPAFEAWAAKRPAFFPRIGQWKSPDLPFSVRTVLRREYSGLMGIVFAFFILESVENYAVWNRIVLDVDLTIALLVAVLLFLVLRGLKRNTSLLNVSGR